MSSVAIIPARGGSKRIPRKNIRPFFGKPIISYAIQTAIASGLFTEVMVSTDDTEIASISRASGAQVPFFRSGLNSNDFASTSDVLTEVLDSYCRLGKNFEKACCIYPATPLITVEHLRKGMELLETKNFDSVFPVVKFGYPVWRALKMSGNTVSMVWPENLNKRSQDLPETFHDAGQWYWFRVDRFLEEKKLWMNNSYGMEVSSLDVQDVDNEIDWKMAELKFSLRTHESHI